jgi:DNA-directed RNA polymerase subunit RPC12/RpoP
MVAVMRTCTDEPNREGTLYKVLLPEEIPSCAEAMRSAQVALPPSAPDERKEGDFYNVPENRLRVFERDEYKCRYCGKQLTRFTATLDPLQPVSNGGDNSLDNLTTACLHCNSRRVARPVMDALAPNEK